MLFCRADGGGERDNPTAYLIASRVYCIARCCLGAAGGERSAMREKSRAHARHYGVAAVRSTAGRRRSAGTSKHGVEWGSNAKGEVWGPTPGLQEKTRRLNVRADATRKRAPVGRAGHAMAVIGTSFPRLSGKMIPWVGKREEPSGSQARSSQARGQIKEVLAHAHVSLISPS